MPIIGMTRRIYMKKREIITLSALAFSMGVVLGFLIAPAKNGFGNNERNITNNYYINEDPTES